MFWKPERDSFCCSYGYQTLVTSWYIFVSQKNQTSELNPLFLIHFHLDEISKKLTVFSLG